MARLAVAHTKATGSAGRVATNNPTGVDIDLAQVTTVSQVRAAFNRILLELQAGRELTP